MTSLVIIQEEKNLCRIYRVNEKICNQVSLARLMYVNFHLLTKSCALYTCRINNYCCIIQRNLLHFG
jgi:hypothetical protein